MNKILKKSILARSVFNMLILLVLTITRVNAQSSRPNRLAIWIEDMKRSETFQPVSFFHTVSNTRMNQEVKSGVSFTLDLSVLNKFLQEKPEAITLQLPELNGRKYELELARVQILSDRFSAGTKGNSPLERIDYAPGLYFRGIIKGDPASVASISFFDHDMMGLISDASGNYNIGKLRDEPGTFIMYNDKDMITAPTIDCSTAFVPPDAGKGEIPNLATVNCKVVKCYYECDFAMYQDFSSNTTNVVNYLTGAFNNEATLYSNDGVTIEISQVYVWTSTDPEAAFSSTSTVNNEFSNQTGGSFNGDMAQFLTTRNLGGGIAQGFNGLCNKTQAHSTAQIYTTYSSVPTYSWTIEVMTHEMGHLLGSRHTHACVWNGNNTAIDGCAGGVEGNCALPGNPPGGGTIMSYCHLTGVGINFSLGFGPQPAALILGNVNNAACITGSGAGTPAGLTTTNITSNSATLNWNSVPSAVQYTVEYKTSAAGNYTPLGTFTTNSAGLTGLSGSTTYNWRVQADCSPFATASFTTTANPGCGIPSGLSASNIKSTSAKLTWSAFAGAYEYGVRYKINGTQVWNYATSTSNTKTISNLLPSTKYNWGVKSKCTGGPITAYSSTKTFTTKSLAAPGNYCASNGSDPSLEHLSNVTFGTINNTTGNNGGYADFTAIVTNIAPSASYSLGVGITKSNPSDVEYVSVWIDYNRDGDFTDGNELVFAANSTNTAFSGNVNVPSGASIGQARMRVTVEYGNAPVPCGTYTYGETEDYLVNITTSPINPDNNRQAFNEELSIFDFSVFPNPANTQIQLQISSESFNHFELSILTPAGQEVRKVVLSGEYAALDISDLDRGFFLLQLKDRSGNVATRKLIKN